MAVEAALLAMRRDGVLSTDKGGRPPDPAWVAAALDAFQLLPTGVRLGTEVQALRQELGGGASLRGWLEQRGVDGRQTRQLGTWLERLSLVRPAPRQVATVLFDWVSVPAGTEPCPEAALRAWLARLLAATCSEGRDAARASWPAARIRALRGGELFRIAWDRVASVSRGAATREMTQAAAIRLEHASAARLRALGGSDVPRFWRAVGEAVATRDSGHRSLLVANRIILEAVEEGARGGGGKRARVSRSMEQAEPTDGRREAWVGLLREMGTSDRDAVVVTFRAIRGLLAQYDGWR
jgi:hypothetical protein